MNKLSLSLFRCSHSTHRTIRWIVAVALVPLLASCANKPITPDDAVVVLSGGVIVEQAKDFPYQSVIYEIEDERTRKTYDLWHGYLWEDQCNRPRVYFAERVCYQPQRLALPPGDYRLKAYTIAADWGMWRFQFRQPHWNHRFTATKGEVIYLGRFTYHFKGAGGHADRMRNSYFSVSDNQTMDISTLEEISAQWPVRRALPPASGQ